MKKNTVLIICSIFMAVCIALLAFCIVFFINYDGDNGNDEQISEVSPSATPTNSEKKMYVINTQTGVDLKSEPSMSATVLVSVPLGGEVMVKNGQIQNGYIEVSYNGTQGYIPSNNLTEHEIVAQTQVGEKNSASQQTTANSSPYVIDKVSVEDTMYVVNVSNAIYLRAVPEENSANITTIPYGESVGYIADCGNGFYKIKYNGQYGYAKAMYLSTVPPYSGRGKAYDYRTVSGVEYSIYLRTAPSNSADHYCEIPVGTSVIYYGPAGNGFSEIEYNGIVGYAKTQYLR